MNNPTLLVVAGCNGAGKSSFSKTVAGKNIIPFDYDLHFLKIYNSIMDFELKDRMAHNKTRELLEQSVEEAMLNNADFCYETNFNSTPLFWPKKFKDKGYKLAMVFFCLDSIDKAKERVQIRVENGGHFVPEREIEKRFKDGYENLNRHFQEFDILHLYNSSDYNEVPKHILTISKDEFLLSGELPEFLKTLIPNIWSRGR